MASAVMTLQAATGEMRFAVKLYNNRQPKAILAYHKEKACLQALKAVLVSCSYIQQAACRTHCTHASARSTQATPASAFQPSSAPQPGKQSKSYTVLEQLMETFSSPTSYSTMRAPVDSQTWQTAHCKLPQRLWTKIFSSSRSCPSHSSYTESAPAILTRAANRPGALDPASSALNPDAGSEATGWLKLFYLLVA